MRKPNKRWRPSKTESRPNSPPRVWTNSRPGSTGSPGKLSQVPGWMGKPSRRRCPMWWSGSPQPPPRAGSACHEGSAHTGPTVQLVDEQALKVLRPLLHSLHGNRYTPVSLKQQAVPPCPPSQFLNIHFLQTPFLLFCCVPSGRDFAPCRKGTRFSLVLSLCDKERTPFLLLLLVLLLLLYRSISHGIDRLSAVWAPRVNAL